MWLRLYCKHILNNVRQKPTQFLISVFMTILCFIMALQTLNIRHWMVRNALEDNEMQYCNADIVIDTDAASSSRFLRLEDVYRVLPVEVKALGSIELPLFTEDDSPIFAVAVDVKAAAEVMQFAFLDYGMVSTSTLDSAIFISEEVAQKHSLKVGDALRCSFFGMENTYTVQGISRQPYMSDYDAMLSIYSVMNTLRRHYSQLALFGDTDAIYTHVYVYVDSSSGVSIEDCAAKLEADSVFADKRLALTQSISNNEIGFFERFIPLIIFLVILLPTITNFCCFYILSRQRTETNRLFYVQGLRPDLQLGLQSAEIVVYCLLGILVGFGLSFGISPIIMRFLRFPYITYQVDAQYFLNSLYAALIALGSALLTTAFFAVYEHGQHAPRRHPRLQGHYKVGAILSACLLVVAAALLIVMESVNAESRANWGFATLGVWLVLFVVSMPVVTYGVTHWGARHTERRIFNSLSRHRTPRENQAILLYALKNLRSCKNYHNLCRLMVLLFAINVMTMSACIGASSLPREFDNLWDADYGVAYYGEDVEEALMSSPLVEDVTHFYHAKIDFGSSADNRVMALDNYAIMDAHYTPTRAPKGNEIAVSNVIADYFRLKVGDTIEGVIEDYPYTFVVSEIFGGKSTLAYVDLDYCQELKYNTLLVTVKDGVTLSELKADAIRDAAISTAVVMPVSDYVKLLYRDAAFYIKCCLVMCIGLLFFSIVGLVNVYFETYRTRRGEYELYFLAGMTPAQVRKMKAFEVLIVVGVSIVFALILSAFIIETARLFFTSYMVDYVRYIFW